MKKILHLLVFIIYFTSCNSQDRNSNISKEDFKNPNYIYFELNKNEKNKFIWLNVFNKLNDEPTLIKLQPKENKFIDSISTEKEVEVTTSYIGEKCSQSSYRFYPGDSVFFEFDKDNQPIATIKNRKINSKELNFFNYLNERTIGINRYRLQQIFAKSRNLPNLPITKEESILLTKNFLDTFHIGQNISDSFYNSIKTQLELIEVSFLLSEKEHANGLLYNKDKIDTYINRPELLKNLYYRSFLKKYYELVILNGTPQETLALSKSYSYIKNNFEGSIKDYFLFISILNLKKSKLYTIYLDSFYIDCRTNKYLDYVKENSIDIHEKGNKDVLLTQKKEFRQLDSLLITLKGKVIYIDFWASWCSPCLAEMPTSMKMRQSFKNQNIVFLYISTDNNFSDWKGVRSKALLDNYPYSFLLINSEQSSIKKTNNIITLPRYIIINKKGKVVNMDAPRPSDPKLKPLLDKLIAE
jgi:thiol-disulfide isomerase/thioredoxin